MEYVHLGRTGLSVSRICFRDSCPFITDTVIVADLNSATETASLVVPAPQERMAFELRLRKPATLGPSC